MMYTQALKRIASTQGVLQLLFANSSRSIRVGLVNQSAQNFSFVTNEQRDFSSGKKKKTKKTASGAEVTDNEQSAHDDHAASTPNQSLFTPFSLGDIKQIQSTPDHQPPSKEDTIPGRYATVLFTTASQNGALYSVFEDMKFLGEVYANCESFQMFTQNAGVGGKEIRAFNAGLREAGDFHDVTIRFIEVLAENKRLMFIKEIAEKYAKLYQQFNKEEKITVISAYRLSAEEEQQVLTALKANPQNQGKEFVIEFKVEESILGGLQMYTESEFMDMSLASRVDRLAQEIQKAVD